MEHFIIGIGVSTTSEVPVYTAWSKATTLEQGVYEAIFINDELFFATGNYRLAVGLSNNETNFHFVDEVLSFQILEIKEDSLKAESRILKTTGTGLVINPLTVNINRIQ
jgi:hypothetical protein